MSQVEHTKVCWSCEANVSHNATYCPFCGSDLLTSENDSKDMSLKGDGRFQSQPLEESLASLYKPPYSVRNKQGLGVPDHREKTSFTQVTPPKEDPLFQGYDQTEKKENKTVQEAAKAEEPMQGVMWPLLLLSIGINLSLLGLLVLIFSKEGVVHLQWNMRYWFYYILFGISMSYLGIRCLKKL